MYSNLLTLISEFNKIVLFRHQNPDGDAMFSCLGFRQFILDNFPEKEIHIAGIDQYDVVSYKENITDDFIKGSLGIVLDTANIERIDDSRFNLCDKLVKIDHHPPLNNYGLINIVNKAAASCTEVLTDIFTSDVFDKFVFSKKTREYLYCGLLTDSMNFTTTSTTAKTLKCAALLASDDVVVSELYNFVFNVQLEDFNKITSLRQYLKHEGNLGYLFLTEKDLNNLKMNYKDAKNNVGEFGRIKEFNIWGVIAQNDSNHLYEASLRSRKGYQVNETAMKFNGGGHVNASGIKNLTEDDAKKLISELIENSLHQNKID